MTSFPTEYQYFIDKSRYARWLEDNGRREYWPETINRLLDFFEEYIRENKTKKALAAFIAIRPLLFENIHDLKVMPSMRALMSAGPALSRDHVAGYNCAYLVLDSPRSFDEMMYILMCGTGVGFSVERQYVSKLPEVEESFYDTDTIITVHDSKIGWAKAFRELLAMLWVGQVPQWDMSRLRPAGARLKTFGGRSSGPEPLDDLFKFSVATFRKAAGRKLTSLEAHDIACKIGDVVVAGGVRRSALLSLSNLSDDRMRNAKTGQWQHENPQRQLSNNSVCYTETPDLSAFMKEWMSLYDSKTGERGIFSRPAAKAQAEKTGRRDPNHEFGCNPCSEILLRPYQFCNLSEVVVRPEDTTKTILEKAKVAAILGTLQSMLVDFRYLRKIWKRNCEEERLLGVSLTGIMDNYDLTSNVKSLASWKQMVIDTNKEWASILCIEESTATTTVKPSGTVSQLVDSSSGVHARYSPYYVRRVRCDLLDPLTKFMQDHGFPNEVDSFNPKVAVFSFPIKSPKHSVFRDDLDAIEQVEVWERLNEFWCEHKVSCTIYYKDREFLELGAYVYRNFGTMSGISFLPHTDHIYKQAPYEEITYQQFRSLQAEMPKDVNWEEFDQYEQEDNTVGSQSFACSGDVCEVVDLT